MGLKFSDALRLSWSNIAQHKKRSVLIVITISVLFTLIVGLNLVFQGVENTVLDAATIASGGKIYVETGFVPAYQGVSNPAAYLPSNADEIVRKRIERYHGQYVGKVVEYDFENITVAESEEYGQITHYVPDNYRVINYTAIKEFCTSELTEVPEEKLPVLMLKGATLSPEEEATFYAIGELPLPDEISLALPGGFNFLNLALGNSGGYSYTDFMRDFLIIEDENSELVADFITQRTAEMQRQEKEATGSASREVGIIEYPVAVFENPKDFVAYYDQTNADGREYGYSCDYAHSYYCQTRDLFGNAADVAASFLHARLILNLLGVILLIIAVCIATMTLSHVIDEDASTIALYRSMGASSREST